MAKYKFNMDEAFDSIREFNSSELFLAGDYLLKKHFPDDFTGIGPNNLPVLIILLNGLWGTQLFRDPGVIETMASKLSEQWPTICKVLSGLGENTLAEEPVKVYDAATEIFPIILNKNLGHKQHYSFTTKFFHWCTRNHFPIVDSRARKSINGIQQNHGIKRGLVLKTTEEMGDLTYINEYKRWVDFYSDLLKSLSIAECDSLLAVDKESQENTNGALAIKNTLLRVLDKIFYQNGRES